MCKLKKDELLRDAEKECGELKNSIHTYSTVPRLHKQGRRRENTMNIRERVGRVQT